MMELFIGLSLLATALYFSFAEFKRLHSAVTKKTDQPRKENGQFDFKEKKFDGYLTMRKELGL